MAFESANFSNWYASAELRYRPEFRLRSGTEIIPDIGAGVETVLGEQDYTLRANFANGIGPTFDVIGPPRQPTSAIVDVGLTLKGRPGNVIYLRASGRANGSAESGLISFGGLFRL